VIEDRLRAVRLDEPRLDLDVDELVARADQVRGQRRAILGSVVASCAVAVAMMAIGLAAAGREQPRPAAAPSSPTSTTALSPTTPTTDGCFGHTPELTEVIAVHLPKVRLEELASCPVTVYRVVGTSDFLMVGTGDAAVPADGFVLVDDLAAPGDGRLHVYHGPARGDLVVLLAASDGTMVSVSTTGEAVFDLDALIALVTDPALPR
jgi:hypothetical protein